MRYSSSLSAVNCFLPSLSFSKASSLAATACESSTLVCMLPVHCSTPGAPTMHSSACHATLYFHQMQAIQRCSASGIQPGVDLNHQLPQSVTRLSVFVYEHLHGSTFTADAYQEDVLEMNLRCACGAICPHFHSSAPGVHVLHRSTTSRFTAASGSQSSETW